MSQIIVIRMRGKGSYTSADFVSVHIFDCMTAANEFISANTYRGKYWSLSKIIREDEEVDLGVEDMF